MNEKPTGVTGLAVGVFDFFHEGHVGLLHKAADHCERLVVAVHTDEVTRVYKGVQPSNSALERERQIEESGIADIVVIDSDREGLCRRFGVKRVFHGDDWEFEAYLNHFGPGLVEELGIELVMLPHTPGVFSSGIRAEIPKIGWWLYPSIPGKERHTFFDHLRGLYAQVGGTWFVCSKGRPLVREHFPEAPCIWMEDGLDKTRAARRLAEQGLDLIITANFDYDPIVQVLQRCENPPIVVGVSHGRSGKPGTSADVSRQRGMKLDPGSNVSHVFQRGRVTVHDWSYSGLHYCHLDRFLVAGGSFVNPVPKYDRPRVLVLPTWCWGDPNDAGLVLGRHWHGVFKALSAECEIVVSPHPFNDHDQIQDFARATNSKVLSAEGKSFEVVPHANVVVSDLSGVFWEALMFDTPVILASATTELSWPDDLPPSFEEVQRIVAVATPSNLAEAVLTATRKRQPEQRKLAEARLGGIDGEATRRTAERILSLLD